MRDDDQLAFLLGDQPMRLKPLVDGGWGVWAELWGLIDLQPGSMSKARVRFEQIRGRKVVVAHTPSGRRFFGIAYQPTNVTAAWKKRVGMYRVVAPSDDYNPIESIRLYVAANGQLMAEATLKLSEMPVAIAVRVMDAHTVVGEGLGRNQGMRMTADAKGDLYLAGLRFRKSVSSSGISAHFLASARCRDSARRGMTHSKTAQNSARCRSRRFSAR